MIGRVQLPVWSPVDLRILAAGASGLLRASAARRVLEARLRDHYAASAVLTTDSGTSALALALTAARRTAGDLPVALPAYSCWDLASAAAAADVRVRLYDVDPVTLAPDAASLRAALRAGVSAVVVAHLYGVPAPLDEIAGDVHAAGGLLIEDAAQSFGTTIDGRPAGSSGDLTVLSFGRGKGLTGGRGGALLARGTVAESLAATLPLRRHASAGAADLVTLAALWLLGRPAIYSLPASLPQLRLGETVYHPPGDPADQSGVCAAAVSAAWSASLAESAVRRRHAARLLLGRMEAIEVRPGVEPGYLRVPLLVPDNAVVAHDAHARSLGILPGYPAALCDLPQLAARVAAGGGSHAGARELARRLITLPAHSRLTERDLAGIERWLTLTQAQRAARDVSGGRMVTPTLAD